MNGVLSSRKRRPQHNQMTTEFYTILAAVLGIGGFMLVGIFANLWVAIGVFIMVWAIKIEITRL